ncbi:MAG: EF-hand domain-containing protein [Gallionella sp.]|nr:EF-hand domain-containing protein [Gallionella sp.]
MKKTVIYLAVVSGFTLGATLAHAEPMGHDGQMHGQMGDKMFKDADTDGDGAISRAEFDTVHTKRFKEMDTNNDGKITRDEMKAMRDKMMEKGKGARFDEADANHDGALTREEAEKMPMLSRNFDKVDANHDGKVTREEMDAEMGKMRRGRESKK